jgi:hypothetical protein
VRIDDPGTAPVPAGVTALLAECRSDVEELIATGRIGQAAELAERTGVDFDPTSFPMYFTGAFDSRLVLVHLNPKLSPRLRGARFADFDAYFDAHRRFGFHHWGRDPTYRSAFDHKQVRFLRPFGTIDFEPDTGDASRRRNAQRAIDRKLQMELVPYPSPTFPTQRFTGELLKAHFGRVLGVVASYDRDFVLFCGAVFDELLDRSGRLVSRREHRFRLPTANGISKSDYRFSSVVLDHESGPIRAGVARSFATQGLPMSAYGERCHALYGDDS